MSHRMVCKKLLPGLVSLFMLQLGVGCVGGEEDSDSMSSDQGLHSAPGFDLEEEPAGEEGVDETAPLADVEPDEPGEPGEMFPHDPHDCDQIVLACEQGDESLLLDYPECFDGPPAASEEPCEHLLDAIDLLATDENAESLWSDYEACMGGDVIECAEGEDCMEPVEDPCEHLLGLEGDEPEVEGGWRGTPYEVCIEEHYGAPVGDECESILIELEHDPEFAHEVYEEYLAAMYYEESDPCEGILHGFEYARTPDEAEAIQEIYDRCIAT